MEFCGCGDLAQKVDRYKKRKQHVDEVTEGLAGAYCAFAASAPPPHCPPHSTVRLPSPLPAHLTQPSLTATPTALFVPGSA